MVNGYWAFEWACSMRHEIKHKIDHRWFSFLFNLKEMFTWTSPDTDSHRLLHFPNFHPPSKNPISQSIIAHWVGHRGFAWPEPNVFLHVSNSPNHWLLTRSPYYDRTRVKCGPHSFVSSWLSYIAILFADPTSLCHPHVPLKSKLTLQPHHSATWLKS